MLLLIALFLCHYLADYTPLSRPYMLKAKRFGTPLSPILSHAGVHSVLMWAALLAFGVSLEVANCLALVQWFSHFGIDWLKGRLNVWFFSLTDATKPAHWAVFGADQLAHSLVILLMWYAVMHGKTI
jgi:hypothetical protein